MAQYKVLVLGSEDEPLEAERAELADIDCEIVQAKPTSEGEAMELVRDADAILMRGPWGTEQVINATQNCQVLSVYSHGFNHIDSEACTDKGIIVTNGAGMCFEEVSDQACAYIMSLYRHIVPANISVKAGDWRGENVILPMKPLDESTIGIIGFGNIGKAIARKMSSWRPETLVYDPYVGPWVFKEYGVEQVFDLKDIFSRSDYVVTILPLNNETYHMIGKEHFDVMKSTAYFINVCRGAIVRETELIDALNAGKMRGAGLDVFEQEPVDHNNPLLKMDNVVVSPHLAGGSTRSGVLAPHRAAAQVAAVLRGQWPMAGQNPEVRANIDLRKNATAVAPN